MKEQKPVWDRKKAWWTRILFALLLLFLSTAHAEASEIEEEQALKEAKEAVEEAPFGEFGFEEVTGARKHVPGREDGFFQDGERG